MSRAETNYSIALRENKTYVIAEISANHNHDLRRAEQIVEAAAASGADAVKLQTYTADTLTIDCDNEFFRIEGTLWDGKTLYELYRDAYTPWEWHAPLKELAVGIGLDFFSTPFDRSAVDFLENLEVDIYKVASFELVDIPLLKAIASTNKPVIMSTGMASLAEIEEAVGALRQNGTESLALLKCTSAYPALPEEINLRSLPLLSTLFSCPVGLSDHTLSSTVPVAAVAMGARIIEKHLTLSRSDAGPDSAFSMEPEEFKQMTADIRVAEKALGQVQFEPSLHEQESRSFRRSLFVVEDMKAGEPFTEYNVRSIRPAYGMHTRHLEEILGRSATRAITKGTPLSWELIR